MNSFPLTMTAVDKSFMQGGVSVSVLRNTSVTFTAQHAYAIIGASGSGKSTFMHILAGLDVPDNGAVYYGNANLYTLTYDERKAFLNKTIGLVFQLPYLIRELSVAENVMMPGLIAGQTIEQSYDRVRDLLTIVGLLDKIDSKPATLSGGQQQRVAIARALFNKPTFLLADEPTGNLDVKTGKNIIDLLAACQTEWGMGLIISTHDTYVSERMHSCYELDNGALALVRT